MCIQYRGLEKNYASKFWENDFFELCIILHKSGHIKIIEIFEITFFACFC